MPAGQAVLSVRAVSVRHDRGGRLGPHRASDPAATGGACHPGFPLTRWFVVLNYLLRKKLFGTVQTHFGKVISIENVSRADHGMITTEYFCLLCRSTVCLTRLPDPGGYSAEVSQITGHLWRAPRPQAATGGLLPGKGCLRAEDGLRALRGSLGVAPSGAVVTLVSLHYTMTFARARTTSVPVHDVRPGSGCPKVHACTVFGAQNLPPAAGAGRVDELRNVDVVARQCHHGDISARHGGVCSYRVKENALCAPVSP